MSAPETPAAAAIKPLAGKFGAGTFEIFGNLPVRPGDTMFGLLAVKVDGDRLDLVFAAQGEEEQEDRHFALSIWGASGVKASDAGITIAKATRARWAATNEWIVHGHDVETVGAKGKQPLPKGPAIKIS